MNTVAVGFGLVGDAAAGEPPLAIHPVAHFGRLMERLERATYAPRRINGLSHTVIGVSIAVGVGLALERAVGAFTSTAIAVGICAAGRMLDDEATAIGEMLARGDIDAARVRLPALAGRDPSQLDEHEIARAVVESIAENGVDAVTATACWGAAAGAPGALAHRAVNTLDAMIGHLDERYTRFGWSAARLDDVANYIPARLTAIAITAARPRRARDIWRTIRRDAPRHPSPNAGIVEAAFAAALDVQLGGVNRYDGVVEDRGALGDGRRPEPADIARAVALRRQSTIVLVAGLVAVQAATQCAVRRRNR